VVASTIWQNRLIPAQRDLRRTDRADVGSDLTNSPVDSAGFRLFRNSQRQWLPPARLTITHSNWITSFIAGSLVMDIFAAHSEGFAARTARS
jgi:hypothetical protein